MILRIFEYFNLFNSIFPHFKIILQKTLKLFGIYDLLKWKYIKFKRRKSNSPEIIPARFLELLRPNDLCFDIGAWEGEFLEILLKKGLNVVAVEPQIECVRRLNIMYGKDKKVKILWNALGKNKCLSQIYLCQESTQSSTMSNRFIKDSRFSKNHHWNTSQSVYVTTLNSLIERFGIPKYCKIDVEGYEENVINGLSTPIEYISFEFHKEFLDIATRCCQILEELGNYRFNYAIHAPKIEFEFSNWQIYEDVINNIEINQNILLSGDIYAKLIN